MMRYRLALMARSMIPATLLFAVIVAFCVIAGAHWPGTWHVNPPRVPEAEIQNMRNGVYRDRVGQDDLIAFTLVVIFLFTKAVTMIRQMGKPFDWLAISLASANLLFSMLYLVAIFQALFPLWFAVHYGFGDDLRDYLRYCLIAVLAWAIWTLTSTPTRRERRRLLQQAQEARS